MTPSEKTALRDRLLGELIGLARSTEGNDHLVSWSTDQTVLAGLCAIGDLDSISQGTIATLLQQVDEEKRKLVPMCYQCGAPCGRNNAFDISTLSQAEAAILTAKKQVLAFLCAAAAAPTRKDKAFFSLAYRALYAIGREDWGSETLLQIAGEAKKYC